MRQKKEIQTRLETVKSEIKYLKLEIKRQENYPVACRLKEQLNHKKEIRDIYRWIVM